MLSGRGAPFPSRITKALLASQNEVRKFCICDRAFVDVMYDRYKWQTYLWIGISSGRCPLPIVEALVLSLRYPNLLLVGLLLLLKPSICESKSGESREEGTKLPRGEGDLSRDFPNNPNREGFATLPKLVLPPLHSTPPRRPSSQGVASHPKSPSCPANVGARQTHALEATGGRVRK